MTSRRKWGLGIAAVAVVALLAVLVRPSPTEPSYAGRSLSEWLELDREASLHPKVVRPEPTPREAIRSIGTNAIPCLVRWIVEANAAPLKDSVAFRVATHLPGSLRPMHPERWTSFEKRMARAEASVRGFRILGPAAASAIPELERIAATLHVESEVSASVLMYRPGITSDMFALSALMDMAPQSLPAIERLIQGTNPFVKIFATEWLRRQQAETGITNWLRGQSAQAVWTNK